MKPIWMFVIGALLASGAVYWMVAPEKTPQTQATSTVTSPAQAAGEGGGGIRPEPQTSATDANKAGEAQQPATEASNQQAPVSQNAASQNTSRDNVARDEQRGGWRRPSPMDRSPKGVQVARGNAGANRQTAGTQTTQPAPSNQTATPAPTQTAQNTTPAQNNTPALTNGPVTQSPRVDEPRRIEEPRKPERVARTVTIPAGTLVTVRMDEPVSAERNFSGDVFRAVLDQPVIVDGLVIAERGSRVQGRVVDVDKGGRVKGVSTLSVELTTLTTSDGQRVKLNSDNFTKTAESSTKSDAAKVGAAAGIGALIGAIAGGGKGAAIGAGVGGAAGAGGVMATRGRAAELPVESKVSFKLREAVTITEKLN